MISMIMTVLMVSVVGVIMMSGAAVAGDPDPQSLSLSVSLNHIVIDKNHCVRQ